MYTLGQLARVIWGWDDIPGATLDVLLTQPATGLALALKSGAAKSADPEQIGALVDKLPADLSDPHGGVKIEDQGPFWLGYYHYMSAIDKSATCGPAELEKAGQLLFGERWQPDLARALNIGDRRVREFMAGERRIPPGVWADITALLRQRSAEGLTMVRELSKPARRA